MDSTTSRSGADRETGAAVEDGSDNEAGAAGTIPADGDDPWLLGFDGFDPETEGRREALCTLGNGYWGTRGAAPECAADAVHNPGTSLAGVYNPLHTDLGEHSRDDEHMVNAPNWLPLCFRLAGGDWFRPGSPDVLDYRQELDLRRGVLTRFVRIRDGAGRTSTVTSLRFVSQAAPHLAVLETTFEAEDWSGQVTVRSGIDGRVANRNVVADALLAADHLVARSTDQVTADTVLLQMETTRSGVHIAMAARTRAFAGDRPLSPERRFESDPAGWVAQEFDLPLEQGHPVRVEKTVAVSTSRDRAVLSVATAVTTWL